MAIRILVVEDEAQIADFITRGLREEGFTVEHAADGDAGWRALYAGNWDVVLLDWWLPGPDGLTLLGRLRELDQITPVLFLTARDTISNRVRALNAGADDYLCKPFAFEELLARVRALARRRDGGTCVVRSHGVHLDIATRRTERNGQYVDLTGREQALLLFFLRHVGELLSRTRIYEQVWEERFDGESNTLEVHVGELRRKLESHGPRLIHTVRNRGYVFGDLPAASLKDRR